MQYDSLRDGSSLFSSPKLPEALLTHLTQTIFFFERFGCIRVDSQKDIPLRTVPSILAFMCFQMTLGSVSIIFKFCFSRRKRKEATFFIFKKKKKKTAFPRVRFWMNCRAIFCFFFLKSQVRRWEMLKKTKKRRDDRH